MTSIVDRAVLRGVPHHWRPLVAGYGLAVATLVVVTMLVVPFRGAAWVASLYDTVLPAVLFASPVAVGAASGALDGGALPTLGLGAVPSLAWTFAVVAGDVLRLLLGIPRPIPDSPLWAIAGAFLVIGLVGALGGFAVGRVALFAWRRAGAG